MSREPIAALFPHHSTPLLAVRSLTVRVGAELPGRLVFQYRLEADLARLRVPAHSAGHGAGQRADGLWKHTCFEAFVAVAGETAYRELNFSPSGDWAAYEFTDYRQDMAPAQLSAPPLIEVSEGKGRLQLDAQVAWPAIPPQAVLRVGLSAVIETEDGSLSYWAVKHPPGYRPDFHHPESMAIEVST